MAGVRVTHAFVRNARFTIVEEKIPYNPPFQCTPPEMGGCGMIHIFKTHHLNVGEDGSVIIGDILYEKLRGLLVLNGFSESNIVKKPPTMGIGLAPQTIGSGAWGNIPIISGVGERHG